MLSWSVNKITVVATIICGFMAGALFIQTVPLAQIHRIYLLAVPLFLCFMLLATLHIKSALIFILFSRALLDPFLNETKINFQGDSIGLGALINLMVILLAVLAWLRSNERSQIFSNSAIKAWFVFLCVSLITVLYSPVQGKAIRLIFSHSSYLSMMVLATLLTQTVYDKYFWINALAIASLIPVGYANLDLWRGGTFYPEVGSRILGTFSHPNILAFYLVLMIAIVFYALKNYGWKLKPFQKNLLRVYLINLFLLLLSTKTRNAWLSCWLFFFIYGLWKDKKVLILCVVTPIILIWNSTILERIQNLFYGTGTELESKLNSFTWRILLWKQAWYWISENFWLGHGLGSFNFYSTSFFDPSNLSPAHNVYVELLFEAGIIGLLSYLSIFIGIIVQFLRQHNLLPIPSRRALAVFVAYIVSYLFSCGGDNIQDYLTFNWYFYFWAGVLMAPFKERAP